MLKQNVGQEVAVDVFSRIGGAVDAVAVAIEKFDVGSLGTARDMLRSALDPITERSVFLIAADGWNQAPDAPKFRLPPSEAVFLNLLSGAVEAGSRSNAAVSGRRRAAGLWRAIEQATRSVVLGAAWSVEAHDLVLNVRTATPEAQARQMGLRVLLPLVEQWAAGALAPAPEIRIPEGNLASLSEFRQRWPTALPQALPGAPADRRLFPPLRSEWATMGGDRRVQTPRTGLIAKWFAALQSLEIQSMAGKIRLSVDDRMTLQREVLKYTVMGSGKIPEEAGALPFPSGLSEADLRNMLAENIGQGRADDVFSLIEGAVGDVVDAIEGYDLAALDGARKKLGRALDPITERIAFVVGADGWTITADAPTFRLVPSEAVFLNLLSGGAEAAGRLPLQVSGQRRAAAVWRAIEQATRASVGGASWTVAAQDLKLAPNTAPTKFEADARRLVLQRLLPLVEQWSSRGLTPAPSIRHGDGRLESLSEFRSGQASGTLETLRTIPARVDDAHPLRAPLARIAQTTLDRRAGTLTIDGGGNGGTRRRTILRFDGIADPAALADRVRQDGQIRLLDDFITVHFQSGDALGLRDLPSEIVLAGDQIRVVDLVLARRRTEGDWAVDVDNLRYLDDQVVPAARQGSPLDAWGPVPVDPMPTREPTTPRTHLRLYLQLEDSALELEQAAALRARYPDSAVWVQIGMDGEVRVVSGGNLLKKLSPSVTIKVEMGAHVRTAPDGLSREMGSHPAEMLAAKVDTALRKLGLPRRVQQISLHGCALESSAFKGSYTSAFLREANGLGYLLPDAQATAYRTIVSGYGDGGTLTQRHSLEPWRWPEPGDALTFTIKRGADGSAPVGKDVVIDRSEKRLPPDKTMRQWTRDPKPNGGSGGNSTMSSRLLAAWPPQARAFFDGIDIDAIGPLPLTSDAMPGTVLERAMAGIARQSAPGREDPWGLSAITEDNALTGLRADGMVDVDAQGAPRLQVDKLTAVIAGNDDALLMRTAGRFLSLPEAVFNRVVASPAGKAASRLVTKLRAVRASLRRVDWASSTNWGLGAVNTAIGAYQIAQGWRTMDAAMKGLSIVQTSSLLITPLTARLGAWLSALGIVGRSRVLTLISRALAGGAVDLPLSALGLILIGLQWKEFHKSGLGTDSYAYRSLVANTVMVTTFATAGLVLSGVTVAAAFSTSLSLGVVASAAGPAGLAIALLTLAVAGPVNTGLWMDEYGDHLRESMSTGDAIATAFALFFGVRNDAIARAEVSKTAVDAAAARQAALKEAWEDLMAFRADGLAKLGIGTVHYPDRRVVVTHATFHVPHQDPSYSFVLQDRPADAVAQKTLQRDAIPTGRPPGIAWLGLDVRGAGAPVVRDEPADQWIEMAGADKDVVGGRGRDRFLLDSGSRGRIDGHEGVDDVVLHAGRADVILRPDPEEEAPQRRYLLSVRQTGKGVGRDTRMAHVERLTIRDAAMVDLQGGPDDDLFDVEARSGRIAGGGGRNTYILRPGHWNWITTTSNDVAVWSPGASAVIEYRYDQPADTVVQTGMLHEALTFGRDGDWLILGHGQDRLVLIDFFRRSEEVPRDRQLLIVDALGTRMVLANPGEASRSGPQSSATMDKTLFLDARTHASRRRLGGDPARTRYQLAAGGGAFHAAPRTVVLLDILLDVPVSRLRYHRVDDGVRIQELAPGDAPSGYTPLSLMLPAPNGADVGRPGPILWARSDATPQGAVMLMRPAPGDPDQGPMRTMRAMAAPGMGLPLDVTPAPVASDGQALAVDDRIATGTAGDDVLDAALLPRAEVLKGGEGADDYRIPAGRSIVIDNTANDGERDVLHLAVDPARLRFRRDADDLLIDTGDATIRLRGHASDPGARHLALGLGPHGHRHAIPVIHASGVMMYADDPADGRVPGFVPGSHFVQAPRGAAWTDGSRFAEGTLTRHIALGQGTRFLREGHSLLLSSGADETSSKVVIRDYYRTFRHFEIDPLSWQAGRYETFPGGDGLHPLLADGLAQTWRRYQSMGAPAATLALLHARGIVDEPRVKQVSRVARILVNGTDDETSEVDPGAVRLYLEMMGLPATVAQAIRSTRPAHLRRLRDLLHVASAADVALPAAFLDAYAASDVDTVLTPDRHGLLLAHLAADGIPWTYAERVLLHDLPLEVLDVFEAWARAQPGDALPAGELRRHLDEFARLLSAGPDDPFVATGRTASLLEQVLRIKGRPAEVAERLAAAMVAVGTMDESWIDGLQRAGVHDHAMLKRLRDARVSAQDLLLGNANRLAYEGSGDRSELVSVDAQGVLGERPGSRPSRLVVRKYLRLDASGDWFDLAHDAPEAGVRYDLVPGDVVLPSLAPHRDIAEVARLHDAARKRAARLHPEGSSRTWARDREIAAATLAPDPSARLREKGFAEVVIDPPLQATVWWGRSVPGNLVDGVKTPGEVTAWRPFIFESSGDPDIHLSRFLSAERPLLSVEFKHAVALSGLELSFAAAPRPDGSPARWGTGFWRLHAIGADGQEVNLSGDLRIDGEKDLRIVVDTQGVPYRRYRLGGFAGKYPIDAWLTEVTFTTAEAGLSPMIARLMAGGYSREDSDALMARGVMTEAAVSRAVEMRQRLGALAPALLADDLLTQPRLTEEIWDDLDRLKPFVPATVLLREARQGWSAGSRAFLLADLLPPAAAPVAIDRAAMAPVLHDAWSSWRTGHGADLADLAPGHDDALVEAVLDAASGDPRAVARALHLPGWRTLTLGGQRTATRPVDLDAPRLRELLTPPADGMARPTAAFDAPFLLAADGLIHLATTLHRRLVLHADEGQAVGATAPLLLQLANVAAWMSGLPLQLRQLRRPTGSSPGEAALRAALDAIALSLPRPGAARTPDSAIVDRPFPGDIEPAALAAIGASDGPLHRALTLLKGLGHDQWGYERFSTGAFARHRLGVKEGLMAAVYPGADLPILPGLDRLTDLILRAVAREPDALPQALQFAAALLHGASIQDPLRAGKEAVLLVGQTMKTVIDAWRTGRQALFERYDAQVCFVPETLADILLSAASDLPYAFHLPRRTRDLSAANDGLVMRRRIAGDLQAVRDAGLLKVTVLSDARPEHGVLDWRQPQAGGPWTTEVSPLAVFQEPGLYMLSLGMRPDEITTVFNAGIRTVEEIDRMRHFESAVIRDRALSIAWAMSDARPALDPGVERWIRRLHGLGVRTEEIFDLVKDGVSDTERALVLVDQLPYETWSQARLDAADLVPLRADIERSAIRWMSPGDSSTFSGLLIRAICGDRSALGDAVRLVPGPGVLLEVTDGLYDKLLALSSDRLGEARSAEAALPFALTLLTLKEVQGGEPLYLPADRPDTPRKTGEARVLANAASALQRLVDVGILGAYGIHETTPGYDGPLPLRTFGGKTLWRSPLPLTQVLKSPPSSVAPLQAALLSQAMSEPTSLRMLMEGAMLDMALSRSIGGMPRRQQEASAMLAAPTG
ncbi:C80 family cysteine peptidase [Mitsuaria sp. CC2]|uniref:C80 family cysteine peptidase n=1 Tax=Mitsuaria sp. CC2 TaxID=3029186 RepID=UPI003B8E154D